ncbi:MAG: TonB-dependent receptor [Pseudomonadota bacterium]
MYLSLLMITTGLPIPASAQSSNEPLILEEVVVTGSRIKRRDFTSPTPIQTVDRREIEAAGRLTLDEVMIRLPQLAPDFGRTSNNPGDGTARVNLRGLGASRTLALLNGRRLAPSGVGNSFDVNNLPRTLIDRVEVITGGAAAVYGSDAVAGVVNFITRTDVDGLGLDVDFGVTADGDAQSRDINITYGSEVFDDRGRITGYVGVLERDSLLAGEREFTRLALVDGDFTGSLQPGGSFRVPELLIFQPVDLGMDVGFPVFDPAGNPRVFNNPEDQFNFAPLNYLQVPLTRFNAGFFSEVTLTSAAELYSEISFTRNESRSRLASVSAGGALTVNLDNPLLTASTSQLLADNFSSDGVTATFPYGRRLSEVGPRITENERDYLRVVVGVRGQLSDHWDYDGWLSYTDNSESTLFLNDASESRFAQGVLVSPATGECVDPQGGCVPVNPFGPGNISVDAADFLRIDNVENRTERSQTNLAFFVTGPLFKGWAGAIDLAAGASWRQDKADFRADEVLFAGDTLGFRGEAAVRGTDEVFETFAELKIPLLSELSGARYLGIEAGLRYSDYKFSEGQWTYKLGGEWEPVSGLRLRAMQQRAVRAPNVGELFEEQFEESTFTASVFTPDPCSSSLDPVGNGNVEKCLQQGLNLDQIGVFEAVLPTTGITVRGGNSQLEPETADTLTIGAVIEPEFMPAWSFSVDYFDFDVDDAIGQIDTSAICFDQRNIDGLFCDNIQRDTNGNIVRIEELINNRGSLNVSGVDTQLRFEGTLPSYLSLDRYSASVSVTASWTHLLEYEQQENLVSTTLSCVGRFGTPCFDGDIFDGAQTFPRNRLTTITQYESGPLSAQLTWQYIQGTRNAAPLGIPFQTADDPQLAVSDIGSKNYFDLSLGFKVSEKLLLRASVNNLSDTSPPLMADAVLQNNTDSGLYDVFGRSYFVSMRLRTGD